VSKSQAEAPSLEGAAKAAPEIAPSKVPVRSWYSLGLLTFAYALATTDRFTINILLEPMKNEFGATDTQMGILSGASFIIFYLIFGIPMARLSDRGNRSMLMAASVTIWSAFTALTGVATNIWMAIASRIGLGASESACLPASMSLISDLFPENRRQLAASIFQGGMPLGMIALGPLAGYMAHNFGWRFTLIALAVPGLLLGPLIYFTLKEPLRRAASAVRDTASVSTLVNNSVWKDLSILFGNRRFAYLFLSQIMIGIATSVIVVWLGVYLMRQFGMSIQTMAILAGLGMGGTMFVAYILSGLVTTYMIERTGNRHFASTVPGVFAILAAPLGGLMLFAPTLEVCLAVAAVFFLLMFTSRPAGNNLILEVVPASQHGLATSMIMVAVNLVGGGLGVLVVGMASDWLSPTYGAAQSLKWALVGAIPIQVALSGVAFLLISGITKRSKTDSE
jgi:MFS family permease